MDVKQIVILVFILLVVLYLIINAFSKTSQLTKMADGKIAQTLTADKMKNVKNTSNFTYSMWIFVDDWNYNYGQEKNVLNRANGPSVFLGDKPNTLKVKMSYYDPTKASTGGGSGGSGGGASPSLAPLNAATKAACAACVSGYTCACESCNNGVPDAGTSPEALAQAELMRQQGLNNSTVNTCQIDNIPIQKWVNVIISLFGLTLDVYLDGKLVRTCVLPGVPRVDNSLGITVSDNGGFSGWTTNFKYWADASNPQQAYNIYKDGFGGNALANALNKYRVQVSVLKGNVQQGSFQI